MVKIAINGVTQIVLIMFVIECPVNADIDVKLIDMILIAMFVHPIAGNVILERCGVIFAILGHMENIVRKFAKVVTWSVTR